MTPFRRGLVRWIIAIAVVGAVAGVAVLLQSHSLPNGVEPIAWDRAVCARCAMHIGEPHFAVQLQTTDGNVLNFDDPGCLFFYERERHPSVHAMYFHHARDDRWIPRSDVAFVTVASSPMGYAFGAVQRGTTGSISYEEARDRVLRGTPRREGE